MPGGSNGSDGGIKPVVANLTRGADKDLESGKGGHTDAVLLVGNEVRVRSELLSMKQMRKSPPLAVVMDATPAHNGQPLASQQYSRVKCT
jgi:hypothetical protein